MSCSCRVARTLSWMSSVDMTFIVVHYRVVGQLPVVSHSCDVNEVASKIVCVDVCLITISGVAGLS